MKDLHGIYPVVPTPLHNDESLDLDGLSKLINFYIASGCHGLLMLGSGGESPYFTMDEKFKILEKAVVVAGARVPIITGCSYFGLQETKRFIETAGPIGIDGFLVILPSYYPNKFEDVLYFFEEISTISNKPILYYHYPQITRLYFNKYQMSKIFKNNIQGIKESSVCIAEMKRHLKTVKSDRFALFSGSSKILLKTLELGGAGTMCSLPSIAPEIAVDCYNSFKTGNIKQAKFFQNKLCDLIQLMNTFSLPAVLQKQGFKVISRLPFPLSLGTNPRQAIFKETLRQLGFPINARVRSPLPQITEDEAFNISELIKKEKLYMQDYLTSRRLYSEIELINSVV